MRTLLIGLSTRALAESAVRGGNNVLSLDYFGDKDQKRMVENYSLARDSRLTFSAENLLRASSDLVFDAVVYTSNLENHPEVVASLSRKAVILGNSPEVLARIRDWSVLKGYLHRRSIPHPQTLLAGEETSASKKTDWLCKPAYGGGGAGIRAWNSRPIKQRNILQARVEGLPISAAYVANGKNAVIIGLTNQLIGHQDLGAGGYSWCGNILPPPFDHDQNQSILKLVDKYVAYLVRDFRLKGVGGIDFVVSENTGRDPEPYLLEINPRYAASMELMEKAYNLNIYNLHVEACNGRLPQFSLGEHLDGPYFGKGIVYTYQPVTIRDTQAWLQRGRRDIPFPGDTIKQGHPVCTVLANGGTYADCMRDLLGKAADVRHEINDRGKEG